jgi:hypothetical protein
MLLEMIPRESSVLQDAFSNALNLLLFETAMTLLLTSSYGFLRVQPSPEKMLSGCHNMPSNVLL